MKKDLINKLVETFKNEAEKYSNELEGVVNFKYEEYFKKNNPEKGYHSVDASIIFKEFTLKLEYKINISMLIPKSTVEMRFMFENGKLPVEFSIYDLFNIIDKKNFRCYTFGYVIDETTMQETLRYLIDTFKTYRTRIEKLSVNLEKLQILEKDVEEKVDVLLDEKVFESRDVFYMMHMLELYYTVDISRFTMDSFIYYIEGKNQKAITKYSKNKDKLTKYEKRLLEHLIENKESVEVIPEKINTFAKVKKLKSASAELLPMLLSWLVLTPIWCVVYDMVFYIALHFLSKGATYVGGADPFMIFLPSFITAIINSYFVRKIMYKLFFRKNYNKILALDEIENSERVEAIMSKLFQFIIALGLVFSLLSANTNIAFYEGNFNNNLEFFSLKGETISYADVNCVYKAGGIMNDFGYVVNNPTYVIVLNDGRQISLYYYMEFEDIEKNIVPIFKKNNIEIREIDLVNNIEKDLEKQM